MRAPRRLTQSHTFLCSKAARCAGPNRKEFMKKMKTNSAAVVETGDFRVWCDYCSIRIAPNEERITSDHKMYHQRCYTRSGSSASKVRAASASAASKSLGDKQ